MTITTIKKKIKLSHLSSYCSGGLDDLGGLNTLNDLDGLTNLKGRKYLNGLNEIHLHALVREG